MKEIETQNIEWKESWRDEYLKWICGFANADGGTLFIGKRDDGSIAGLTDAKKLMEEIPNKVRDIMGIMVDVNLKEEADSQYLEIIVESYPNPVNPIQISVYEEQIIIWNSAQISDELPIERLLGKHPSIPHNPLLAGAFFRSGYIEAWGRGIEKIRNECLEANAKEPEIRYDFGGVMVTFKGEVPIEAGFTKPIAEKLPDDFGMISEAMRKQYGKNVEKTFRLILENRYITALELAVKLGMSARTVENYINKLKNAGIVERKGPKLGGYWEIMETKTESK